LETVQHALTIAIGSLVAAGFGGFTLLKAYDEFKKGVEKNSRIRIWISFSLVAFLFLIVAFAMKVRS
jgi:hypothetical protein